MKFKKAKYLNNNLAILIYKNNELYADVTVNLYDFLPEYYGYIHINHLTREDLDYIMNPKNGIIDQVITYTRSGFVDYPLVEFNHEFVDGLSVDA